MNRDYVKADTPEMRGLLRLFAAWLPDFYVDCHVTDGMDFQYSVTFGTEIFQNIDSDIAQWLRGTYIPEMTARVERSGSLIAPYMGAREENDLSKGFIFSAAGPRFSTGYGAAQNRPSVLIETHVYKPYKTRVDATYEVLAATLGIVNLNADTLKRLVRAADEHASATPSQGAFIPMRFAISEQSKPILFKGWRTTRRMSPITGAMMTYYTRDTANIIVPYFDQPVVTDSVQLPEYYLIPQEWSAIIDVLNVHRVAMRRLTAQVTVPVAAYILTEPSWPSGPYEGRQYVRFKTAIVKETRTYPIGTYVVPTAQRTAKVIAHLLEPKSADSFVAWGFFNAIFEMKEYFEDGVMEAMAVKMMAADASLKLDFEERWRTDTTFAKNADARLKYFYERTPYMDASIGMYPVVRYTGTALSEQ